MVLVGPHQPTIAYDKNGIRVLIYTAKVKTALQYFLSHSHFAIASLASVGLSPSRSISVRCVCFECFATACYKRCLSSSCTKGLIIVLQFPFTVVFSPDVLQTMRVKLQLPSGSELPAFNPIQPAQAVTQIMLLANPNREKIRLRYKVMYNIGKQQVTDMGEASEFPVQ